MKNDILGGFTAIFNGINDTPLGTLFKEINDRAEKARVERKKQAEDFHKHFKVEITKTFWGTKVRAIERDKPLS
jgi:hypothetical protein